MNSGEIQISLEALILVFVFSLYLPVVLISYLVVFPRLNVQSRNLSIGMLAAQIFVIVVSLGFQKISSYEAPFWNLDAEGNIPPILASAQLALVSGISLTIAWLAKERTGYQRLYMVGIGLVFLYLALDEYYAVHETIAYWERYFVLLGAALVTATVFVAMHSSRSNCIWHVCMLTGLATSASGAIVIDQYRSKAICWSWEFLRLDKCLEFYPFEESLEFVGIWIVLVAMLGQFSDMGRKPRTVVRRALYMLPLLWILLLLASSLLAIFELEHLAQPASIQFESRIHLFGYRIDNYDRLSVLRLYPSVRRKDYFNLGYSVHFVDQESGNSVASRNQNADRRIQELRFSGFKDAYRQQIEIPIPVQAPANRALWIVLTLWRKKQNGYTYLDITHSDHQLLTKNRVILGEIVLPKLSDASTTVPVAVFNNGFTLDAVAIPERARRGETMTIPFAWRSDVAADEDHIQFLHVGHAESGEWWIYDQQPLGARLPTRLWYSGLHDSEAWQVPLPADIVPGRYDIFTGLYRVRDQQRVPASDAAGNPYLDARVPLGNLMIGSGDGS